MEQCQESVLQAARAGACAQAAEQIEILRALSAIDSGSRYEPGNLQVVELVEGLLRKIPGIATQRHYSPGVGTHLVARLRPENPRGKILLNAHLDTVFQTGDAARHPWRVEGDRAYGLGIADCKGGVLVAIYAVKILAQAGLLPQKEIVFLFNCDEEIGSPTAQEIFAPEVEGAEMAFVFEAGRGDNGIITARKAPLSMTLTVRGRASHAGVNYADGRSATVELAHKILSLYGRNDDARGLQFNFAHLSGGEGGTGVVPDFAQAKVGVRVSTPADVETVRGIIQEVASDTFIPGTVTTITIDEMGHPMERTPGNVALYQRVRRTGALLGMELSEQSTGGGGDSGYFTCQGIPTVDALGPYMYEIHSTNESLRLSSLQERTTLFAAVLGLLDQPL